MLSLSPNPKQNISYSFYFPRISSPLTCQLSLQHLIKVKQFYFIYISSSLQPPTTHSLFFLCLYFFFLLFVCFFLLQSAPLLPPTIFITFRSILLSSHACVFLLQIQVHTSQFPFVNFFSFIFFIPRPFFPKISLSLSENFPIFIFWHSFFPEYQNFTWDARSGQHQPKLKMVRNQGVTCTRLPTGMKNSGHFGQNGTEFKTLTFTKLKETKAAMTKSPLLKQNFPFRLQETLIGDHFNKIIL